MGDWLNWALGIRRPPSWAQGGAWRLEFQALPQGAALAAACGGAMACVALVWWLYRREGRQLSIPVRLACAGLRLLVFVGVAFMLLELAVVITQREQVP